MSSKEHTLQSAKSLIQDKGEFSYRYINPLERGTFLEELIEIGKVAKEGFYHYANAPSGELLDKWFLRHRLGLGGVIKNDLYASCELWQLDAGKYQIIYYKAFGLGNYAETKSELYDDVAVAKDRFSGVTHTIEKDVDDIQKRGVQHADK